MEPEAPIAELDSIVSIRISLRNADNQLVTWNRPCTVNLEVTYPSKKAAQQQIVIPAGQSSAVASLDASEYGVAQIRAKESSDSLLSAGNTVFVSSAAQKRKNVAKKKRSRDSALLEIHPRSAIETLVLRASWSGKEFGLPQDSASGPTHSTEPPPTPQLLLVNSTGKEAILADGKDFARVSVYYMAPDGEGAPSDIVLWMSWSNGVFSPQPIIIRRGELAAEGRLASSSPLEATVELVRAAPKVALPGTSTLKLTFSPPIYGFGPATRESIVKMSLIDREPVVGCFFNGDGQCIQPDKMQPVNASSTNPTLHVDPASADVSVDDGTATFYLEPTWTGTANLDMWAPG